MHATATCAHYVFPSHITHPSSHPTQTDNDVNASVDLLSNPQQFEALQLEIAKKKDKGKAKATPDGHVDEDAVQGLVAMGFRCEVARDALQAAHGDQAAALDTLVAMGEEAQDPAALVGGGEGGGEAGPSGAAGALHGADDGADPGREPQAEEEHMDAAVIEELEGNVSHDPLEAYDVEDLTAYATLLEQYLTLCASS